MKRILIAVAATLAFLLPASATASDAPVHSHSSHSNIDWD